MKKIILSILVILIANACTENFEKLNQNVKKPESVPAPTLLTSAEKNLADRIATPNVNSNIFRLLVQHWTEAQYTTESRYNLTNRNIPRNFWYPLYRDVLINFAEAAKIIKADLTLADSVKLNQLAIVDVLEVYTFSVLVDTYGDVPYKQALDYSNLNPKYDDAATIYDDLILRLDNSISSINVNLGSFDSGEIIYGGDMNSWLKFANSLKLRLGMRLADVGDGSKAKLIVEQAAPNVFTSNSDNALFYYQSDFPTFSSIWNELVYQNRKDFVASETMIGIMDSLGDPRIPLYFTNSQSGLTTFTGAVNGLVNEFTEFSAPSFYDGYDDPNTKIKRSTIQQFPTTLLDYSEVEFYLSEAIERGFNVGGTAETHYKNAIEASILDWGGTSSDVTSYLSNPLVAYSSAGGDFKYKIGLQKWISLNNRGFEAWAEYRRLDSPQLLPVYSPAGPFPLRFPYPDTEQTLNPGSWSEATSKIGGDIVTAKVFWDKN